jgi:hypothetical protein
MPDVLFALVTDRQALDALLAPPAQPAGGSLIVRVHENAADLHHLLDKVRAGNDRDENRWLRGMAGCIALGAGLGGIAAGVMAGAFGLLGGRLEIGITFGVLVGAFLGGFSGAMAGTQVPRDDVRKVAAGFRPGMLLVTLKVGDPALLELLMQRLRASGCEWARRE